jgi:hypothetical protein
VDVRVVFWIDSLQLGMDGFVAGAGQTGKSLVDLDEGIADMEVGVVVISWEPAGGCVGYLVGLWREALTLYKPSEWLCIAEGFCF